MCEMIKSHRETSENESSKSKKLYHCNITLFSNISLSGIFISRSTLNLSPTKKNLFYCNSLDLSSNAAYIQWINVASVKPILSSASLEELPATNPKALSIENYLSLDITCLLLSPTQQLPVPFDACQSRLYCLWFIYLYCVIWSDYNYKQPTATVNLICNFWFSYRYEWIFIIEYRQQIFFNILQKLS